MVSVLKSRQQSNPEWLDGKHVRFLHATAPTIALHKPHPGNIVKMYVIDDVLRVLTEGGLI